jgi:hypothetical protein
MSLLGTLLGIPEEPVDVHAKQELELYAYNTFELHAQHEAIIANLLKKIQAGRYDHKLAPKLWEYWIESAAKAYCKEFCSAGQPWHKMFPTNLRRELAKEVADQEYRKITGGEYEMNFKPKLSGPCGGVRMGSGRFMTKSEAEAEFKEYVMPGLRTRYEQDGVPDKPARREAWNDFIDGLIRDGRLPSNAGNWSHPRGLETRSY